MPSKIKFNSPYQHSFDYFYDKVKDKPLFSQSMWEKAANTGSLESYVVELSELENVTDIEQFENDYNLDYLDEDQIRMAMQNEVYKDKLSQMVKKDAIRYKTDEQGNYILENGQPIEEKYETNLYDYNKSLLIGQANYKREQNYNQALKDYKESLSPFAKWLAGAAINMGQFGIRAGKKLDGILSIFYGIGAGAIDSIKEGSNYFDNLVERIASDDVRITEKYLDKKSKELGYNIEEAIFNVERVMTDNRDLNGNYSNLWEELTASLWQTAGEMIPSMIIGGSIGGAVGKVFKFNPDKAAKVTSGITNVLFYSGIAANDIKETYDYFAENDISVPSQAILSNSLIKAGIQMAIEKLLDNIKFFKGPSGLDTMSGRAVKKSYAGKAWTKLITDPVREGIEEVLQDVSDNVINEAYSYFVQENFGELSDLSFHNLLLSFLAGAVMSVGVSIIDIITTRKVSTDQIEILKSQDIPKSIFNVKKGQIPIVNEDGIIVDKNTGKKIEYKKLSKIASWNYNMNLRSYIESLSKLTELDTEYRSGAFAPGTKAHNEYVQAVSNAYQSVRILSSIFKTVGQEEFENSMNLLETMNKNMMRGAYVSGLGELVKDNFANTLSGLSAKSKSKLLDKIVEAHMDSVEKIVDIDNVEDVEYDEETDKKLKKLLNKYKKVVISETGNKALTDENEELLIIPKKQLINTSVESIQQQVNEDIIVDYIISNRKKLNLTNVTFEHILDLYKNTFGKEVSIERAIFQFLYDDNFRNIVVRVEDKGYEILQNLLKLKNEFKTDEQLLSNKITIIETKIKSTLINLLEDYPQLQTKADLTIFNESERNDIKRKSYTLNLSDKYVENNIISKDEREIVKRRINNGLLTAEEREYLLSIINNNEASKQQREYLIKILDRQYNYIFKGKYNNIVYLEEKGKFTNILFNRFLKSNNIDLRNINRNNIAELTESFKVFTGNRFSFKINEKGINIYSIGEVKDRKLDFGYYSTVDRGTTFLIPSQTQKEIQSFISDEYDKDSITINDLIYDKKFLNQKTKKEIINYYNLKSENDISNEHIFEYLNKELQNKYMKIGIDKEYNFVLLDLKQYKEIFAKGNYSLNNLLAKTGGFIRGKDSTKPIKLKDLGIIEEDYIKHVPEDANLLIVKGDGYINTGSYNPSTNTITLVYKEDIANENVLSTFAHEFQHMVSHNNSLIEGGNVFLNRLSVNNAIRLLNLLVKEKLIAPLKYDETKIREIIENNSFRDLYESEEGTAERYIADIFVSIYKSIQGEVDANALVNKMLPFILYTDKNNKTYFYTPFGQSFELGENRFKEDETILKTDNTSQLISYDIPSPEKPLTERQKKIQENKLKKPIYYKPGKYKIAKLDEKGNIIRDEKGRIKYEYKQDVYETRYAGKKESAGTNLEKYGYVTKELQNDFKSFIVKATPDIDKDIWTKLTEGKLNKNYVLRKVKEGNLDNKTFELINDTFFKNTEIKNQEELDTYVELTSEYAALYYTLKRTNLLEKYGDKITKDNIKQVIDIISRDNVLSKMYIDYEENFNKSWGKELNIDRGLLRLNWLSKFDGTIYTAGHIANIARRTAIQTYFVVNKEVSLESKITGTDLSIEDTLRDDSAQDAFDEIINDLSDNQEFEALKRLIILQSQKKAEKEDANKTEVYKETKSKLARLQTIYDETPEKIHTMFIAQTSKMTVEQKHKLLIGTVIEEQLDRKLKENEEKKLEELSKKFATKYERTTRNIINNIAHTAITISNRLTANEKRRFLDKNKDLFHSLNNKIVIKQGWYKGKTKQELEQIEEHVRGLSREVKAGAWHSAKEYKEFKKLEAEVEKLRNELINEKLKTKRKVITVSDENIIVNTSVEMPSKLKQILDNVFNKTAKTKVQEISLEDSEHITQNYYSFVENNASVLNSLTNEEVEEIINFYLSSEVLPETNKVRQYLATRLFVSTFIIKQNEAGIFNISQENIDNLTTSVEKIVSIGAQIPSLWKQSLKAIRDTREMLVKGLGNEMLNITFEKGTIQKLNNAIDSGDYEKIKIARKEMYEEGISKLKEEKKLTKKDSKYYLEKFIQFERMMMLSGPGTWVRNQISNIVIGGLRAPSEKIGSATTKVLEKLFPKKFKKEVFGQYKLVGTKVTSEVKSFIKSELIDNDLLKLISNGLSKQTSADIDYSYKVDNIVELIKQGIKNDLRSKAQFDSKLINTTFNFIYKMMSDDKSVNRTMLEYFGKMLTEKNVNLKNGMTNEVIKILVDAYTFAASEYMHKTNLMTEFENWLKGKNYKVFFMYKQLFPFAAASWNWFVEGLNYTPIGLVKSIIQYAKLENTITKIEDEGKISSEFAQYATIKNIGKGVIGSIGTIIGALLAAFGIARLDEEDDKYKLFIGNTAIDISDVFGTQSILISMAIVSSIKDDEDLMSVLSTALDAIFEDSTFQDTINLFRYSDTFSDFLLYLPDKFLRAMIPNFFKQIASIVNIKEVKYSNGIKGRIERLAVQSVPGIAYLLPHYIDPYTGEEQIPYNMPILTNIINKLTPINIYPYRVSDLEKEAISLGINKGMLTGEYTINNNDVKLNAEQRKSLNEYYAKLNKADLTDLTTNKTKYKVQNEQGTYDNLYYKDMTEKQKATIIDRIMSNNSGYAKTYILTQQMGYKYYTTNSERETLRELGITNNIYVKNNKYNGYVK